MLIFPPRHPISRANFFMKLAESCGPDKRDDFEAYLEAAIIFARSAMHHLKNRYEKHSEWAHWWDSLRQNSAVEFFREHRDFALKEGMPKVTQHVGFNSISSAAELYSFESNETATETVKKHLKSMAFLIQQAVQLFETTP